MILTSPINQLRQYRAELSGEIKSLAKRESSWTAADKTEWDRLNAEYDKTVERIAKEEPRIEAAQKNRAAIDKELAELGDNFTQADVNRIIDRNGGGRVTGEIPSDFGQPKRPAGPTGDVFRDAATGREFRALRPKDRFCVNPEPGLLGRSIVNLVLGRPMDANVGGGDAAGGYLLSPELSGQVIDIARSASVVSKAGAQILPMSTSEHTIARLVTDPVTTWRPEATAIPSSDIQLDRVVLRAKTLAAVVPVAVELIEDSSNAAQVIEMGLRGAMGAALDAAVLDGDGVNKPLGILRNNDAQLQAAIGLPTTSDYVLNGIEKALNANFPGAVSELAWVAHPRDAALIMRLKDSTGAPLPPSQWFFDVQKFTTTSLPSALGAGNNESSAIIGHFPSVVLGVRSNIVIRVLSSGSVQDSSGRTFNAASQLGRLVVAYLRSDAIILRPTFFTKCTGIKNA